MIDRLSAGEIISIENLGTFSPYLFHGHKGWSHGKNGLVEYPPFTTVRFHPADALEKLLLLKEEQFRKKKTKKHKKPVDSFPG